MNPTPHGPGWESLPAKMSKRHPEWRHAERRITVTVYAADASVDVTTSKPMATSDDAVFVRDAFAMDRASVKWTPGGKGRRCTITEVTQ